MNRYIVGVTNPPYTVHAASYFQSLPLIRSAKPVCLLLDFTPATDEEGKIEAALRQTMPWLEFRHLPMPVTVSFGMVQDSFISALPELPDDAVVCLTDLDAKWQRDFTEAEWANIEAGCDDNSIWAYWNCGEGDTLALEAERIGLSEEWTKNIPPTPTILSSTPCYNCGFLIASAGVFRRIQEQYARNYEYFFKQSSHRSRCQFLLNWVWWLLDLNIRLLPPQIHQHAHVVVNGEIRLPVVAEMRWDVLTVGDGVPVVFRHHLPQDMT